MRGIGFQGFVARPLRIEFEGAIYHVCTRGNGRQRIFGDERDRAHFLQLLGQSTERFEGAVLGFVLMANHLHLVVQTRRANLGRWMQWLNVAYTVFFNRRHHGSGHLFQGRYKSFLVQESHYLVSLSRYVHLNPVRGVSLGRGTVAERRKRLRKFKWSSYPGSAGLSAPFPFVDDSRILHELGGPKIGARLGYRRFVEEGLLREVSNPFEAVKWQAVLGEESFVQKMRDRIRRLHKQTREISGGRRISRELDPQKILKRVADRYGVKPEHLRERRGYGVPARAVAMWMVWESGGCSLREIGELFGGLDYAAVAQRIRRARATFDELKAAKLRKEMLNV